MNIFRLVPITVFFLISTAIAHADTIIPHFIAFQSSFSDDGGNLIEDESRAVTFRINDETGNLLYEDIQSITSSNGVISAIIGNGLSPDGAVIDGIPESVFDQPGQLYLEVEVEGVPEYAPMSIASVPYAYQSQRANTVKDNVISSSSIIDGSIIYDDLSKELLDRLAIEISNGKGKDAIVTRDELDTLYRSQSASSNIGIKPTLIYSSSTNIQDTLSDLDRAIKRRDEKVDTETGDRKEAITTSIEDLKNNEIKTVSDGLTKEIKDRGDAIEGLKTNEIKTLNEGLGKEIMDRTNAIDGLKTNEIKTLNEGLGKEIIDRTNAIDGLKTNEIKTISDGLTKEIGDRGDAIEGLRTNEIKTISDGLTSEINNRNQAIEGLKTNEIKTISDGLTKEIKGREDAIEGLKISEITPINNKLTPLFTYVTDMDTTEIASSAIQDGPPLDTKIQEEIDNRVAQYGSLDAKIQREIDSRIIEDSLLNTTIQGEIIRGTNQYNALNNRISQLIPAHAWGEIREDGSILTSPPNFATIEHHWGGFTVRFATPLSNGNYVAMLTPNQPTDRLIYVQNKTTSGFDVQCRDFQSCPTFSFVIFGPR